MSNKKALIQIGRKETSTKAKIEIEVDRSLFSEINEYARFAKIPGRVLKEKRERLVVAMIEKILADDVAFAEYKAEQKKEKAAKRKESKENVKQLKKELIAESAEQEPKAKK